MAPGRGRYNQSGESEKNEKRGDDRERDKEARNDGKNNFQKSNLLIFFLMRKENSTNQIAGYSILFRDLLILGADFVFWKFSLCDW